MIFKFLNYKLSVFYTYYFNLKLDLLVFKGLFCYKFIFRYLKEDL